MGIINQSLFGSMTPEQATALAELHTHTNQGLLDKLSESNGELFMNGNPVDTTLDVETTQSPLKITNKLLTFSIENLPEL